MRAPDEDCARFAPDEADFYACKKRIQPAWVDYVQHVSPRNMAMSLNSCTYILWLCRTFSPKSAIDWGSGLTSYVLRLACDNVTTVDDSDEWLGKTKKFLKRYRMPADGFYLYDDYPGAQHDLVVYDFSCGETRNNNFERAIGELSPEGVGVMDDVNHEGHHAAMEKACAAHGRELFSLEPFTNDPFGRFAALVR